MAAISASCAAAPVRACARCCSPAIWCAASWRARLDEHLGHYAIDGLNLRAGALLSTPYAVYAVTHLAALVRLLPERDPHENVFEALDGIFDSLDVPLRHGGERRAV